MYSSYNFSVSQKQCQKNYFLMFKCLDCHFLIFHFLVYLSYSFQKGCRNGFTLLIRTEHLQDIQHRLVSGLQGLVCKPCVFHVKSTAGPPHSSPLPTPMEARLSPKHPSLQPGCPSGCQMEGQATQGPCSCCPSSSDPTTFHQVACPAQWPELRCSSRLRAYVCSRA